MKKIILLSTVCAALCLPGLAGDKKLTGYVSDSFCGAGNANDTPASKECALRCVKDGAAPVFVDSATQKVYQFATPAKANGFVGEKVVVTGEISGEKLDVKTIAKAAKS